MVHLAYREPATYPHVSAINPDEWMASALCAQTDPDIWYPTRSGDSPTDSRLAKRICRRCPVQAECLAYGMKYDPQDGIYGGMTARERAAARSAS